MQKTLVLIKPDALQRGLVGEITHRFERKGLKLVGLKMVSVSDALVEEHYAHHKDKPFFSGLKSFMQSSPIVAMVLEGVDAALTVRKMAGITKSREADFGTIRGDFGMSVQANLIHVSEDEKAAEDEVKRFFKEEELFDYQRPFDANIYGEEERI
ncbi:MAG TPA: nucleoside-diphosphate kinase [Candidatus Saccharimonadales bacterium]|nr:nucleoside-diphosphate kinase [Candidatus Saccharimonadales bacterium]